VLARRSGLDRKYTPLLRAFGLREIVSGLGLLVGRNDQAWLWSRVGGDVLDVGFLTFAFVREKNADKRKMIAISAASVAPVVILDVVNVMRKEGESSDEFDSRAQAA
jgi:hypothetical protein